MEFVSPNDTCRQSERQIGPFKQPLNGTKLPPAVTGKIEIDRAISNGQNTGYSPVVIALRRARILRNSTHSENAMAK